MGNKGGGGSFGVSRSKTTTKQPAWARRLGKGLAEGFEGLFTGPGLFKTGLTQPLGILGNQYQNLFGDNPAADFLGARSALERSLSGAAMGDYYNQALGYLLPGAQRSIDEASRAIRSQMANNGLRFSSDLADLTGKTASDILANTSQQATGFANALYNSQLQGALNVYDLIGSLSTGQMQRQIPLAISLATGTPTETKSKSKSWSTSGWGSG